MAKTYVALVAWLTVCFAKIAKQILATATVGGEEVTLNGQLTCLVLGKALVVGAGRDYYAILIHAWEQVPYIRGALWWDVVYYAAVGKIYQNCLYLGLADTATLGYESFIDGHQRCKQTTIKTEQLLYNRVGGGGGAVEQV